MAFPVLYSWYHSNSASVGHIPMVEAASVPQEDLAAQEDLAGCEAREMEEEALCWWTGEIMLYYCLVVSLVKVIYVGVELIYRKKFCKPISCKIQKEVKGPSGCRCECEATLAFCGLFKKLFGGQQNENLCACRCIKKKMSACASNLALPAFSDCISSESQSRASHKSSRKKQWSRAKEEQDSGGGSISSRKSPKAEKKPKAQRETWVRKKECPRCKARRTREWLAQHFFDQE